MFVFPVKKKKERKLNICGTQLKHVVLEHFHVKLMGSHLNKCRRENVIIWVSLTSVSHVILTCYCTFEACDFSVQVLASVEHQAKLWRLSCGAFAGTQQWEIFRSIPAFPLRGLSVNSHSFNSSLSGHCWRHCLMTSVGSSGVTSQNPWGLYVVSLFSLLQRVIATMETRQCHTCKASCGRWMSGGKGERKDSFCAISIKVCFKCCEMG